MSGVADNMRDRCGLCRHGANAADVIDDLCEALALFESQWNACGPNSDFGRYFQNVRHAANAALAKARGEQ